MMQLFRGLFKIKETCFPTEFKCTNSIAFCNLWLIVIALLIIIFQGGFMAIALLTILDLVTYF